MAYDDQPQQPRGPAGARLRNWAAPAVIAAATITVAVIAAAGGLAKTAPAPTVTFSVTGDPADVTWGPAGSSLQGTVPMSEVMPLGDAAWYALDARLRGDGAVTCRIAVGGTVISQAAAMGAYHLALCEISRDPLTGEWESTTG